MERFRSTPAYVLLGDPGAGKTTTFRCECAALGNAACYVTARDFLTFAPENHPEWCSKTLFIDGLDESRAGTQDKRTPFDHIRGRLDQLGKPRFRLSCRTADWLGTNDRRHLVSVTPQGSEVTVLRLDPLTDADAKTVLAARSDITDPDTFISDARARGLDGLLSNPQSLGLLAKVVAKKGTWPKSRRQTFEEACRQLAAEHNEEHRDAGPPPEVEAALDAAGRLCAMLLITGSAGFTTDPGHRDGDYLDPECASDPCAPHGRYNRNTLLRALSTKLFAAAAEQWFIPVHRHLAEFLGARHLERLIAAGLPARRVLALITGEDGGVVTQLRGLATWLAALCKDARRDLIERDPIGVVLYGDVHDFTTDEKRTLLSRTGLLKELKFTGEKRMILWQSRKGLLTGLQAGDKLKVLAGATPDALVADAAMSFLRAIFGGPARDRQRVLRRDAGYQHPSAAQVRRTLRNGPPANSGDLAALITDRIDELAVRIRTANTDDWRQYWNVDQYERPCEPKPENSCRDALLSDLQQELPPEVDAQPEGAYANDRRADVRVSCRGFHVPIEAKRNSHRDLWRAIRRQLIEQYANDPTTGGYGIYLVFWFGTQCTPRPPGCGAPPNRPDALREQLEALLTKDERRRISVRVIDVSAPPR